MAEQVSTRKLQMVIKPTVHDCCTVTFEYGFMLSTRIAVHGAITSIYQVLDQLSSTRYNNQATYHHSGARAWKNHEYCKRIVNCVNVAFDPFQPISNIEEWHEKWTRCHSYTINNSHI